MTRTTIDLDPTVLAELKARSRREGRSLGQLTSELLAGALASPHTDGPASIRWRSSSMGALVDIDDKEAVWRALDER
jgi:hypothetical protein